MSIRELNHNVAGTLNRMQRDFDQMDADKAALADAAPKPVAGLMMNNTQSAASAMLKASDNMPGLARFRQNAQAMTVDPSYSQPMVDSIRLFSSSQTVNGMVQTIPVNPLAPQGFVGGIDFTLSAEEEVAMHKAEHAPAVLAAKEAYDANPADEDLREKYLEALAEYDPEFSDLKDDRDLAFDDLDEADEESKKDYEEAEQAMNEAIPAVLKDAKDVMGVKEEKKEEAVEKAEEKKPADAAAPVADKPVAAEDGIPAAAIEAKKAELVKGGYTAEEAAKIVDAAVKKAKEDEGEYADVDSLNELFEGFPAQKKSDNDWAVAFSKWYAKNVQGVKKGDVDALIYERVYRKGSVLELTRDDKVGGSKMQGAVVKAACNDTDPPLAVGDKVAYDPNNGGGWWKMKSDGKTKEAEISTNQKKGSYRTFRGGFLGSKPRQNCICSNHLTSGS